MKKISEFVAYLDDFGTALFDVTNCRKTIMRDLIPREASIGKWKFTISVEVQEEVRS